MLHESANLHLKSKILSSTCKYTCTILTRHYAPFDYYLHKFAAEVYLSPIYAPLSHTEELCDSDEGEARLELTVPSYIDLFLWVWLQGWQVLFMLPW